ncbi:TPA: hypothetical protein RQJ88_001059 [Vibrio vulnificus]|nr:hypothetical protein [Vibrio vulnificus]HDY7714541.1 hypothetical protein [Vibrio vulnificus]
MVKVKLYKVDHIPIEKVVRTNLAHRRYADDTGFGFEVIGDDEELVIQFTERQILKQEIETLDGSVSVIESVSYIKVKFGIRFGTKYAVYVIDPPRSMKYPFEIIRTLFGSDCNLQPAEFDLKAVLQVFDKSYNHVIKSISLSNIYYDANTLAKTKIVSTKDLHPFYLNNYSDTKAIIDIIHMKVDGIDVELSRTGRFRLHEAKLSKFMLMLERSFQ